MGEMFVGAEEAIAQTAEGRIVVVTDAEDRENEGDLVVGAQFATAEVVNFMARHGRGLICLALDEARCDRLELGLPRRPSVSPHSTLPSRFPSRPGTGSRPASPRMTGPGPSRRPSPLPPRQRTSCAPAMSFRSALGPAAFSNEPGTRRRPSSSLGSPGSSPPPG